MAFIPSPQQVTMIGKAKSGILERSNSSSLAMFLVLNRTIESSLNSVLIPSFKYILDKTESP
jgi:hypothetical protein